VLVVAEFFFVALVATKAMYYVFLKLYEGLVPITNENTRCFEL